MKRLNKSGQFYLVAAVIVVVIIVGMISITNYAKKSENSNVETFGEEFEIESQKVLDYDSLNGQNKIEDFTEVYSSYLGSKINSSFIVGTEGSLEAYTYLNGEKVDLNSSLTVGSEDIIFVYDEVIYNFELEKGKNFYFVFSQDIGGEKYVYTN